MQAQLIRQTGKQLLRLRQFHHFHRNTLAISIGLLLDPAWVFVFFLSPQLLAMPNWQKWRCSVRQREQREWRSVLQAVARTVGSIGLTHAPSRRRAPVIRQPAALAAILRSVLRCG